MSFKLFPYKMKEGQWFKTSNCSESDIIVIVDTTREMIWFWEGSKSSARNRSNARGLLGQLKQRYIVYKFKRITNNSPEDILLSLETLKEKRYTDKISGGKYELKDFTRLLFFLNIIGSILATVTIVYLWSFLFWTETNTYYPIDKNDFLFYISLSSYCLLSSFIIFIISALYGHSLKKDKFATITLIAAIFMFTAFFIIFIWDNMFIYIKLEKEFLIRRDVLLLFVLCLEFLIIPGTVLGIIMGISGGKNISSEEKVEEVEKKQITK